MTNFLSHLVARSLHPEASLQPRPVARFEAVPLSASPSPAMETNEDIPTQPSTVSQLPRVSHETPSEPEIPLRPHQRTLFPTEPIPTPHRGRLDTPLQTEILLQSQTIREHTIERAPVPQPISPTPTVSVPAVEDPAKAQPPSTLLPRLEKPVPQRSLPKESAPIHPILPSPTPQTTPLITPVIRPSLPVALPFQAKAPEAQPTIHVTIGRLEVRATPAPPSTPSPTRPKKASSVMTLDEYLQRRKTGGGI